MNESPLIVVVEDDEDDFFFTQRTLRKFTTGPIFHVPSGHAAIEYLSGTGAYANRAEFPLPNLIFLDLKMDDVSGHDVLAWISRNPASSAPKIFVLTGSNEPRDRELVKSSGVAAGYIVKPLAPDHLKPIFDRAIRAQ